MANFPTWQPVVALALFDGEGRVLLQQRPAHKHHGSLWEFPGGKVESEENPRLALVREISEELGLALDEAQMQPSHFAEENAEREIVLFLYTSRQKCTEPVGKDGQRWGWFAASDARRLALAPMDRELLQRVLP